MKARFSYAVVVRVLVRSTVCAVVSARYAEKAHSIGCDAVCAMLMEHVAGHAENAEQADCELAAELADSN